MTLGPLLERLAAATRLTLPERVRPALEQLRAELEETVDLAVLDGAQLRFVDQLPAPHRLRAVSAVGETFPLHCTANGKALLGLLFGLHDVATRLTVTHDLAHWRDEMAWMALYFSAAVWSSLALCVAYWAYGAT